ncbi:CinA family protein [Nocardioides euryhalodurans]|uniref:CinA family protein n=1 Tax=Nocardioides euryhalodurans TaxID=2518370 RepID=A0A4P7GHU1_9ACTN|nr:CinA family protein [Nocardioides euryhalodurans]QBR91445.1 CinA family protein [Nocardioides euryhalodurans]
MDLPLLLDTLAGRGDTLATAESLTGGRLAALVTGVPGASRVYLGGIVAYATEVKQGLLGVPEELVAQHGVVSAACARAMAEGVRAGLGSTWAVATTGVAGPDEQEGKPVGTVYVGLAGPDGSTVTALELVGDRAAIQERTCREAVSALRARLHGEEPALG